jgi:hypothetical protein
MADGVVAMRYADIAAIVVTCLAVAACASLAEDQNTLYVEYTCNPVGATLYQENTLNLGRCPRTIIYKITDQDRARGSMILKGVTAFWVSGVSSSSSPTISANLANGLHQHFNFERPRDAPNYNVDANYALNLEKNELLKAQVEAIENINVTVDQSSPAPTLRTHCTTNHIGQTAYTNCY